VKRAVVSGLGPNGMLAALKLRRAGFEVVAADQRPAYTRSIHLNLRQSWMDAVRALDAELHQKLEGIARRIEAYEHLGRKPRAAGAAPHTPLLRRLLEEPTLHVRLDELERVFQSHLAALEGVEVLTDTRVSLEGQGVYSARLRPGGKGSTAAGRLVERPRLVVVAEGGKSPTAQGLGLQMLRVSAPRFYISVHVDHALGPVTRRLDTEVDGAHVSYWAVGHQDPARGTWLVLEIPERVHGGRPSSTFDRDYYARGAAQLLQLERAPEPSGVGLRGTFRFEQQLLPRPVAGENVVVLGDAAGMGHHALGTGLELGAWDAGLLGSMLDDGSAPAAALDRYATAVRDARVTLLAFGMHEYYPRLAADPTPWLREAIAAAAADPSVDAVTLLEARLTPSARGA
jgi:2-polyprenyl-6-methoxyphenol hydroxylase-like FAD-dependent oxidoreductase